MDILHVVTAMPPEMTPGVAWMIVGLSFFTSLLTAVFSIGGGYIMLAVLAQFLAPAALIPIHGAVQLGSTAGRAGALIRHLDWSSTLPFMVGAVIGIAAGGLVFIQIPPWIIQLGIGVLLIWTVFGKLPVIDGKKVFATGIVASFLSMFFGSTANFVAAIVKAMNLTPMGHVGTHAMLMAIQHVLKLATFGALGFSFAPYMPFLAWTILSGLAGTLVGKMVLARAGTVYFKPVLNVILLCLAARLLWIGAQGLLSGA